MKTSKFLVWVKANLTSVLIILGIISGMIFGFILRSMFTISPLALTYIGLPGKVLIRAFLLVIVPLIVSSLSTSITATKRGENKRLIGFSFLLIAIFSTFVALFAIILAIITKPGVKSHDTALIHSINQNTSSGRDIKQMMGSRDEAIYDVFLNLVPDNLIGATITQHYTALVPINAQNLSAGYKKVPEKSFKPNMLGLCVISLVLGFTVLHLGERAKTIKALLDETFAITMEILHTLLKVTPIGMFSWMCVEAIRMKSPGQVFTQLAWFAGTVFLAFAVVWIIFYPTVYFLIVRKNPFKMYKNLIPAMIIAIGSSSSAITLPMTLKCMEEKNNLALPISRFFLPLAMTMHMPGTATYYSIATLFVAQMQDMTVTVGMAISLCIFCVIQSMAFPATPAHGGGYVFLLGTCAVIGVENPLEVIAYVMTIDWFMERIRTVTNITGDCVIASILEKICHHEQGEIEAKNDLELKSVDTIGLS